MTAAALGLEVVSEVWPHAFANRDRVMAAASAFGPAVDYSGKADVPPWAVVVAPGVLRLTGSDLEQSYWANRRAIEPRRPHRAGRRGEVTCWTRKSRAKMTLQLASLDWSYLADAAGLPAMLTTTYPADWLPVAGSGAAVKAHLKVLVKRWERAWGEAPRCAWKLEFQDRGAPHVHIGPVVVPFGTAGAARRVQYDADLATWQAAGCPGRAPYFRHVAGDGLPFNRWLSVTWADIVAHPDPVQRAKHESAGTNVSYREGMRCADPKRLAVYFTKHGQWASKGYQHRVPDQWREQGKGPGRFWGYWGLRPCRAVVELRKSEHLLVSRTLRHLSERSYRWNREVGRLEVVRATREVTVTRRRVDQQTGAVTSARRRKVRRPVRRLKYHRGFVCVNDAPALAVSLARLLQ
jgi:hypothetical protein